MTRATHSTRHDPAVPAARWPRRLAAAAFVLALAVVGFAATVASLASLAVPSPAAPTVTTLYLPVPTDPSVTRPGGGR
jgi:hypothetical protein